MKTAYSYVLLVKNTPERHLQQESTLLENKYKKTKYALIQKICHKDGSENIATIFYSNDLQKLIEQMKGYISWYDYVNGFSKNIQGYISEI